jgi:hypothetical protein
MIRKRAGVQANPIALRHNTSMIRVPRPLPARSRAPLNPLLQASWLEATGRARRHLVLAAAGALLALSALVLGTLQFGPSLLAIVGSNAVAADTLMAMLIAVLTYSGRRYYAELYRRNWLSTLPVSRRAVAGIILIRTLCWPVLLLMLLATMALILRLTVADSATTVRTVIPGIAIGALVGVLIGGLSPKRIAAHAHTTVHGAIEITPCAAASLTALSRWATEQTKQWLRPRTLSFLVLPAMLALPLGISGNEAIALLAAFVLLLYLGILLWAIRRAVRAGGGWLRPTPLSFSRTALAERLRAYFALPAALLISLWHIRRAART